MKTTLLAVLAAVVLAAGAPALAQAPQAVSPKDADAPVPDHSLQSLWQEIDCECDCDCCERLKGLIKRRIKDPHGRPQLQGNAPVKKSRRERAIEKRKQRIRHPEGTEGMWDRPWPRSGDSWLDAARMHRYRKARYKQRQEKRRAAGLDLSDEQRERMKEIRHDTRMKQIDLEAALEKRKLELERALEGNPDARELRGLVDAVAKARADLDYHRLTARLEHRRVLTDEQRETLERKKRRR